MDDRTTVVVVSMGLAPVIIHFYGIFHDKPSINGGTFHGNHQKNCIIYSIYSIPQYPRTVFFENSPVDTFLSFFGGTVPDT